MEFRFEGDTIIISGLTAQAIGAEPEGTSQELIENSLLLMQPDFTEIQNALALIQADISAIFQALTYLQSSVNELKSTLTPTPTPTPAPYVLLDRADWTATGSTIPGDPSLSPIAAIDSSEYNRYLSQVDQYSGMWLEFNFNAMLSLRQIEIEWNSSSWARNFKLMPSVDGQTYGSPIFSGAGVSPEISPVQKIQFPVIQCRKVRLEIIEPFGDWLSIVQFRAYS